MTILTFFLQALASLLAIITFLIVLNVQRRMLIPAGLLGMSIWLLYLLLKGPTNVIVATFVAAIVGSCCSQIMSVIYKTPAFFVTGDYSKAMVNATLVVILALVISIGMASGTVALKLFKYIQKRKHVHY